MKLFSLTFSWKYEPGGDWTQNFSVVSSLSQPLERGSSTWLNKNWILILIFLNFNSLFFFKNVFKVGLRCEWNFKQNKRVLNATEEFFFTNLRF